MSGKKKSNWFKAHNNDFYVRLSKKNDYKSRAAYKLIELEEKFSLIRGSKNVLDLGCAPGSWLQVLSSFPNFISIVGVDRLEIDRIQGVEFFRYDISDLSLLDLLTKKFNSKFNLVLSDIAPNITGIEDVDQAHFFEIFESISSICSDFLDKKGILVMKFFNGISCDLVKKRLKKLFNEVNTYKPDSSRSRSNEIFFICIGYKD